MLNPKLETERLILRRYEENILGKIKFLQRKGLVNLNDKKYEKIQLIISQYYDLYQKTNTEENIITEDNAAHRIFFTFIIKTPIICSFNNIIA